MKYMISFKNYDCKVLQKTHDYDTLYVVFMYAWVIIVQIELQGT